MDDRSDTPTQLELTHRVRRHMRILWLALGVFAAPAVMLAAVALLWPTRPAPEWLMIPTFGSGLGFLFATLVYANHSIRTNLRCPECDASIVWLVTYNASVFTAWRPVTECRACHAQIVGPSYFAFMRRLWLTMAGLAALAFLGIALLVIRR